MKRVAGALLLFAVFACSASAAGPVRVSLTGKRAAPVAGRAWTVRLAVRPLSYSGTVRVTASGPGRVSVRATGRRGSFRARLVFPAAGLWRIAARAGGATSRLGSVRVRRPPARPIVFSQPTSIDLEPVGTLLVVENNPGRVLRVNPGNGRVTVLVPEISRPYAVVRTPSGSIYVSVGNQLQRLNASGAPTTVARCLPVSRSGRSQRAGTATSTLTATQVFRLPGGSGPPVRIAGTGEAGGGGDGGPALNAQLSSPHGLAVATDGALLVSDRDNDRVRRIDPATGVIDAFAAIGQPYGIDVAADGTVFVVEGGQSRSWLSASGARLGFIGPAFAIPYDVEVGSGVTYLLDAGPAGHIRRIGPNGAVTTISR
jgi:hypothetical protein